MSIESAADALAAAIFSTRLSRWAWVHPGYWLMVARFWWALLRSIWR